MTKTEAATKRFCPEPRRWRRAGAAAALAMALLIGLATPATAEPRPAQSSAAQSSAAQSSDAQSSTVHASTVQPSDQFAVSVGLGGTWKLGHATPVRIDLGDELAAAAAQVAVSTFDGDGVPVTYRRRLPEGAAAGDGLWCEVTIGRSDQPLTVQVLDGSDQTLARRQLAADHLGKALPPTQPWMVALGSSLGIEATSQTLTETGMPSFTTTVLDDPRGVPDAWLGLAGCDVLVIATSGDAPLISQLNEGQWQAIEGWIERGGQVVLSLGGYSAALPADAPLRRLLPGEVVERLSGISTSPLEASTATNVQLAPITATRLKDVRGVTELAMLDQSGKRFPWWVRYSIGKGVVDYIGSDLDEPVLKQWKDRRLVWDKLLAPFWARSQRENSGSEVSTSGTQYLGYEDLVGQLRATLDAFPEARISSFGEIALILAVILVVIGPLDYWISVRWLRRPELSWYVLAVVLASSSAGLVALERASRPQQLLVNSAQIVDFLPEQKQTFVDGWAHVYSSRARTVDLSLESGSDVRQARLDWQGLPGKGLGGMESNLLSDQGMPGYAIDITRQRDFDAKTLADAAGVEKGDADNGGAGQQPLAAVIGVGIPTSGTKSFFATFSQTFQPQGQSQLRELKGIDQVEGILVNPLDQDILQPVLMYHNWAYQLPSRLRAGEELSVTYDMVPKDLMRRLNRRQIVNNNDVVTPWVPDSRQSLDRLLEIMMFYKASGGFDYTRLQHRFQPRVDISRSLALDHAVLFGKLAEPLASVRIDNVPADEIKHEKHSTWCRVLLPVARAQE
ncbi:MAG: hypothetical protein ACTHOU_19825 [Aureliella sp.]